nr:SRPBCC family protein [Paenibacillus xylanexedens]
MVIVETEILIDAPIELCFDMARDIDVHTQTVWKHTKEKAVAGITSGKVNHDDTVTFEARHFWIRQKLTSRITAYQAPYYFVDEMLKGAFKSLRHEHIFEEQNGKTLMKDRLTMVAPFGVIGWVTERLILKSYMKRFLMYRNQQLKFLIEMQSE